MLFRSDSSEASTRRPHFSPRAKRVIQLFMNGGPYPGDLFDPKPLVGKYAGQRPESVNLRTERKTAGLLPSPFRFQPSGVSGVPVSELLPNLAEQIDDVCVIRSVHTDNPNHESYMPSFQESNDKYNEYWNRWVETPDLDLDVEIDALQADLQLIFDAAES